MSQFDFPRIHVKGKFYFNPGTANNDSMDPFETGPITAITETVQPVDNGLDDESFKKWLASIDPKLKILNGQWNIYGDMSFWFQDVRVCSIQTDPVDISTERSRFPLIGSEVTINRAFALDVDPEGFSTTQIFCDNISFKPSKEAVGDTGVFFSRKPSRGVTRWINWYRNLSYHGLAGSSGAAGGVSATFQMSFAIDQMDLDAANKDTNANYLPGNIKGIYDNFLPINSRGRKLKGMMFRMNLYLCSPLISDKDLYNNYFRKGIEKENPAIGKIVGTFGPWYEDEMESITLSRFLNSANSFSNPYSTNQFPKNQAFLAPVLASVNTDKQVVSLDLVNTFPEDGKCGEKFEMGKATLVTQLNDGSLKPIGSFNYDKETYELFGGMVDVNYDDTIFNDIESGSLAISLDHFKQGPLLLENELMIATDHSCVYLNEEKAENRNVTIRACYKGGNLKEAVTIHIDQWKTTPVSERPNVPKRLEKTEHAFPVSGILNYCLNTRGGSGVRVFRFAHPDFSSEKLNTITDFMCAARVLPRSDYSWVKEEDLNFNLIYREIFRYYYLLLPAMNKMLRMNDASIWNTPTAAEYVLKRSKALLWEEFEYMPRTRELSDDKRALLHRFCNKIIKDNTSELNLK